MRKNYLLLFAVILFTSCSEELPVADFSISQPNNSAPCTIMFTNNSINADNYSWDFGDGETSTLKNPTHIYNQAGNYNVKLDASNDDGKDIASKYIKILQATAYLVSNNTSSALQNVASFYNQDNYLIDRKNHGDLGINSQSAEIVTDRDEISVIFQFDNTWLLVVSPYKITANALNNLTITNNTVVQAVTLSKSSSKNILDSLSSKKIKFGDL